jgi:hypothetical protein
MVVVVEAGRVVATFAAVVVVTGAAVVVVGASVTTVDDLLPPAVSLQAMRSITRRVASQFLRIR